MMMKDDASCRVYFTSSLFLSHDELRDFCVSESEEGREMMWRYNYLRFNY